MVLVPSGNWGIVLLVNVNAANPLVVPRLRAIEQSVTGMVAGGQGATGTGIGSIYLTFDVVAAAILALQAWSLGRLLRRHRGLEVPLCSLGHALDQGRQWVLPLLWEFGLPVAILLGFPRVARGPWGVTILFAPDLSSWLIITGGLWLLTGLVRVVKAGLSLRTQQPEVPLALALPARAEQEKLAHVATRSIKR